MLIEFSVTNYKSIKERQTLSMVASKNKETADVQLLDTAAAGPGTQLLPSAAVYGANASGKTNLLNACLCMRKIVRSTTVESKGKPLPVLPFKLDPETRNAPSEFKIVFIANGVRYQYGFAATQERITEEWLYASPKNRSQRWFTRSWKNEKYQWHFGASLKGEKHLWQKATRDNALFLSTAVQLNSQQLQPIYDWFMSVADTTEPQGWSPEFSVLVCQNEDVKKSMLGLLKIADLGIDDLQIKGDEVYTVHKDATGEDILFPHDHESRGTKNFFSIVGPWISILGNGCVLFADELHSSLHPKLFEFLLSCFSKKNLNLHNAQLIFTTHDASILNREVLRYDQIWFCEKDYTTQATTVFPLTEFHPRKGRENLELTYLSGCYGAVPYISEAQL